MARPTVDLDWAESDVVDPTSGQNNKVEPPAAWKANGWSYQEKPPRNYDNYHKWLTGQWVKYLDQVGVRPATYFVAASDAAAETKLHADAVCDGTDDQVQINAAITAVAATGGLVLLSEGTFTIGGAIAITGATGVALRGMGHGATVVKIADSASASFNMIDVSGGGNVSIADMQVHGNGSSATGDNNGINASSTSGLVISNVQVLVMNRSSAAGHGIVLGSAANLAHISGCYLFGCDGSGIKTDAASLYPRVSDVVVNTSALDGFDIGGGGAWTACTAMSCGNAGFSVPGDGARLSACRAKSNTQTGFEIVGDDVSLTGCLADANTIWGFALSGDRVQADGCKAIGSVVGGIVLTGRNDQVTGCAVSGSTGDGIVLSGATFGRVSGCTVSFNGNDGIKLENSSTMCSVMDNTVESNGQATHNTYYGINVSSATECRIANNDVFMGSASPQQAYGIGGTQLQSANYNRIYNNDLYSSGATAAIEAGSTGVTVPQWIGTTGTTNASDNIYAANRAVL